MPSHAKQKWTSPSRFRKNAFGWHASKLAFQRVKEAAIKKMSRKDPILGGEGGVLFLEKVPPALAHVDSSSDAIGTADDKAIDTLVPIIATASSDGHLRDRWLERLWEAIEEDNNPYIELFPDHWGALCVTPELALHWADTFINTVRMA